MSVVQAFGYPDPYSGMRDNVIQGNVIGSGVTSESIVLKQNILPGDLLVLVFKQMDNRSYGTPTGWTSLGFGTGTTRPMVMFYKVADAADVAAGAVTLTFSSFASYGSFVGSFAIKATNGIVETTTRGNSETAPSITTSYDNELVFYIFASAATSVNVVSSFTPPPGFTLVYNTGQFSSTTTEIFVASKVFPTAGATGTQTATVVGGANYDSTLFAAGRL